MSQDQVGARNRGNQADYVLGTPEGWDAFGVVRWHGVEEIAQPYRYDLTLRRSTAEGPVELDKLLDAGASFRVASQTQWRMVHGILAEAEEIDRTTQIILYRVLLVPHFWHARHRRRCRNFLKQSLCDIVSAVLENRSPAHPGGLGGLARFSAAQAPDLHPSFATFTPPTATYRWDVKDKKSEARLHDPTVRPYVAQYNESDFDFVSRLLEDEGLSYYFEHGQDQVVLAITDQPGVSPMFDGEPTFTWSRLSASGGAREQEIVRSFRDTRRLRSRAVTVRDWDYNRSGRPLQASVEESPDDPDLSRHFEFPVGEEAVKEQPGLHAAEVRMERYDAERAQREGSGTVRTMAPGYRFTLHDGDGLHADAKLLAVRVETFATELTPQHTILDEEPFGFAGAPGPLVTGFDSRFLALPEAVRFRPAMRTPRPRIHGVQAAVVTAEEYPESDRPAIHADKQGRVRVRFPWDQRSDTNDKTPTSRWIRVSQYWAGAGYGALYMPRVGHEVLVAYMQGDPDQPVIVGRVYNVQHPPPYDASKEPTRSTVKSQSAKEKEEVDGFNEIRFDDKAKKEEIFLHAQRDLNEVVLACHSTSVGGDQSNAVGGNQTNAVKGHREHTIDDYETVTVGSDRTTIFQANEHHTVSGFQDTTIGGYQTLDVGGFRRTHVGANDDLAVRGWHNVVVDGGDTLNVHGKRDVFIGAGYTVLTTGSYFSEASANHVFKSTNTYFYPSGDFQVDSTTAGFNQKAEFYVKAGGCELSMKAGVVMITNGAGACIILSGGLISIGAGTAIVATASGPITLGAGAAINLGASGNINGTAANIKFNG
jgi:type VI secretion system secreted protein VgrG